MKRYVVIRAVLCLASIFCAATYEHNQAWLDETRDNVAPADDGYCQLVVKSDHVTRAEIRRKEDDTLEYYAVFDGDGKEALAFKITEAGENVAVVRPLTLENVESASESEVAYCSLGSRHYTIVSSGPLPS